MLLHLHLATRIRRLACRDLQRDFRSFISIITTTSVVCSEGRIHHYLKFVSVNWRGGLRNPMANESVGIKPLLIIIITRTGHSSINSLPFPPSLPMVGYTVVFAWIYSLCAPGIMDFCVGFLDLKIWI
jgi:hypothetical protein